MPNFNGLVTSSWKGPESQGFIESPPIHVGDEARESATKNLQEVFPNTVTPILLRVPLSLIDCRSKLGFKPTECFY